LGLQRMPLELRKNGLKEKKLNAGKII